VLNEVIIFVTYIVINIVQFDIKKMAFTGKSKDISEEYKSALSDLTFNSKPLINVLTMLAEENSDYGQVIVQVICDRIKKVNVDQKMPALYLLDSILKNIGGNYVTIISKYIVEVFCHTFESANDERKRMQLFKLRNTWTQYILAKCLYDLDVRTSKTDPNWPVVAPSSTPAVKSTTSVTPTPKVHINPKFLQKSDAPGETTNDDVTPKTSTSTKQKLLNEEKRVQGQLHLLKTEKIKKDREKHELELRKQQFEREKLLSEQKRQLEILRKQQQNLIDSKKPNNPQSSKNQNATENNKKDRNSERRQRKTSLSNEHGTKDHQKDPRLGRQNEKTKSPTEHVFKHTKVSPKTPNKSALSVVNKIMTNMNVKKTKPSFISSKPASQRPTSFQNTSKRERSKSPAALTQQQQSGQRKDSFEDESNNLDGIMNSMTQTFSPESSQEAKQPTSRSTNQESTKIPVSSSSSSLPLKGEQPLDNSITSVQTAASLQAAALATAGPPPLPPVPPMSSAFSQLSSRDMQIAAQAAAIATAMHQMQSGTSSSMAPQQSAELAAKLIQLVAGSSTSSATSVDTLDTPVLDTAPSLKTEVTASHASTNQEVAVKQLDDIKSTIPKEAVKQQVNVTERDKNRDRSPHRSREHTSIENDRHYVKPERNYRRMSPERSIQRGRSERNSKDGKDEPPSKKAKDAVDNLDRSRKARARSPSRYYFRIEKKIETEKRVEKNEHDLNADRIRRISEGDVQDEQENEVKSKTDSSNVRVHKQTADEFHVMKKDRKKEFRALKNRLLDVQRDHRDDIPGFDISILKNMKYEMSQKLKKNEITKEQYYQLFEIIDIIQDADANRMELKRTYEADRRNMPPQRGNNKDRGPPLGDRYRQPQPHERERPPHHRDIPQHMRDGPPHPRDMPPAHVRDGPPFHPRDAVDHPREIPPHQRGGPMPPMEVAHQMPPHRRGSPHPQLPDGPPHQHLRDDRPPPHLRDGSRPPPVRFDMPPRPGMEMPPQRFEERPPFYGPRDRLPPPSAFHPRPEGPPRQPFPDFPMHQGERFPFKDEAFHQRRHPDHNMLPGMGPQPPIRPMMPQPRPDGRMDQFYQQNPQHMHRNMPPVFRNSPPLQGLSKPPPMDVNNLLGKLLAAGMLEKKVELDIPKIKFTLDDLRKRHAGAIHQLFQGMQCSSCGHRFPLESKVQYSEHLDWHFRQNRRDKDGVHKAISRTWYYDVQDWIEHTENTKAEDVKVQSVFFEAERQDSDDDSELTKESKKRKLNEETSIPVFGGQNDGVCDVCMEELEQYWDEELEEWRYKKSCRANNKTYHTSCFEDYVPFELEDSVSTPTASTITTPLFSMSPPSQPEVKAEDKVDIKTEVKSTTEKEMVEDSSPVYTNSEQVIPVKKENSETSSLLLSTGPVLEIGGTSAVEAKKDRTDCIEVKKEVTEDIKDEPSIEDSIDNKDEFDKDIDSPVYPIVVTPTATLSDFGDKTDFTTDIKIEDVVAMETKSELINVDNEFHKNNSVKQADAVNHPKLNISKIEAS